MVAEGAAESREHTLVVPLAFPGEHGANPFTRADLVFAGVDHAGVSYEVRVFLNNPDATVETPRSEQAGYAGRLTVFGHGGCYGDEGHCDVPEPTNDPRDLRLPHPLTPLDTYVTVTPALRRILDGGGALATVTLVPVSVTPRRSDRKPALDLFRFTDVSLQTYLATSAAAPPSVGA